MFGAPVFGDRSRSVLVWPDSDSACTCVPRNLPFKITSEEVSTPARPRLRACAPARLRPRALALLTPSAAPDVRYLWQVRRHQTDPARKCCRYQGPHPHHHPTHHLPTAGVVRARVFGPYAPKLHSQGGGCLPVGTLRRCLNEATRRDVWCRAPRSSCTRTSMMPRTRTLAADASRRLARAMFVLWKACAALPDLAFLNGPLRADTGVTTSADSTYAIAT
jgi:hypothetical protein